MSFHTDPLRVFGPGWIYDARYEVYFRTNQLTSRLTPILGQLLTEKFQLKYRLGTQIVETLILATPDGEPTRTASNSAKCRSGHPPSEPTIPDVGIRSPGPDISRFPNVDLPVSDADVVFYRGCQVKDTIKDLQQRFRTLVVDETTSSGRYDFDIHFPRSPYSLAHALGPIAEQFTQKLNAELKLARRPLEGTLVIDSAKQIMGPLSSQPHPASR